VVVAAGCRSTRGCHDPDACASCARSESPMMRPLLLFPSTFTRAAAAAGADSGRGEGRRPAGRTGAPAGGDDHTGSKTGLNDDLDVVTCVRRGAGPGGELVAKIAERAGLDERKVFSCVQRVTGASCEPVTIVAEGAGLNAAVRGGAGREVTAGKVDVAAWTRRRCSWWRERSGAGAALNDPVAGRSDRQSLLVVGDGAGAGSGAWAGEMTRLADMPGAPFSWTWRKAHDKGTTDVDYVSSRGQT
jgi:hypothetical protein